jgi:hypothetical protein
MAAPGHTRPPISVVLPFHGSLVEAEAAVAALGALATGPGDELIVADNTEDGVLAMVDAVGIEVLAPPVKRSAYAARNWAAEHVANDWLLFVDADCRFPPDLLDRHFDAQPPASAGAVAGQVAGVPGQPGFVPAYIRSRGHLDQALGLRHPFRPMAVTANLLVRRDAWRAVGGFAEQTRSGADADFCWRLQDAGWTLALNEGARVEHLHRASLRALLAQSRRDGAGGRWLANRWPGCPAHPALGREWLRGIAGAVIWTLCGRFQRARFKLTDALYVTAAALGSWESNATPTAPEAPAPGGELLLRGEFPAHADPAIEGVAAAHPAPMVEARRRPVRQDWAAGRSIRMRFAEDDGPLVRAVALVRLALRRPLAVAAALREHGVSELALHAPAALRRARHPEAGALVAEDGLESAAALIAALSGS